MFDDGISPLGIVGGVVGIILAQIGLRETSFFTKVIGALAIFVIGYIIGSKVSD